MLIENWLPILLLVFLLGALFNLPWLVYFSAAVSALLTLTWFWRNHALDRLSYTRRWRFRRGFPGEKIVLKVEVENRKYLPVSWLRANDPIPLEVGTSDPGLLAPSHMEELGYLVNLYSLRWHQKITRSYELLLRRRGIYPVGPAQLESGDLFGMYEQSKELKQLDLVVVYPELLPFEKIQLRTDDPFGDRRTRRRLFEDPNLTIGVRPYHPEDDMRRIHWPATARAGSLQVRQYQPVSARVLMLCLNIPGQGSYWIDNFSDLLERLASLSATLVYHAVEDGYSVGLLSNGCLAHADQPFHIPPGRSPNQLTMLLSALAGITPFTVAPFEVFLQHNLTQIPLGATLVLVTPQVDAALVAALLNIRRYRWNITLISLAPEPPPEIPGVRVIHLPFAGPEGKSP
ncbi:DUF58 domain-containing protein [bacterium]|nr:MAG: DUF58 domain-containing protein [bacterium]